MKSGFISVIGRPNVGKSTLLNTLIGEKVAIATPKPQTTRNQIRGILNIPAIASSSEYGSTQDSSSNSDSSIVGSSIQNNNQINSGESCELDDYQMIFIDTPGIHKPKNKLGEYMTGTAVNTFNEVDVILFLVDSPYTENGGDEYILESLKEVDTPKFLIINKVDTMDPEDFRKTFEAYENMNLFNDVIGISALNGTHVNKLIDAIKPFMQDGPMYFPGDMITDHPERFIVTEIIREKILMYLEQEVPHGVAIEIEKYEEKPNITKISAVIYTEKKSHKGIIIGKGGRKLKGIGMSAREEIEALIGTKVHLELFVKIKEKWRDSDFMLNSLGYKDK